MSKRKPHNMHKRMLTSTEALLRHHGVCVVNIDPSGKQGLMSWKSLKNVRHSQAMANAICDYPRKWVIYLAAMCQDQRGKRYMKSAELHPEGIYLAEHLTDAIEAHYRDLCDECNPLHLKASGWIAVPVGHSLFADDAWRVLEAAGIWSDENIDAAPQPGPLHTNGQPLPIPCSP